MFAPPRPTPGEGRVKFDELAEYCRRHHAHVTDAEWKGNEWTLMFRIDDDKNIASGIQIDDAGWGCLLGGVVIGAYRLDTQAFVWGEVPVAQFQGNAFTQKAYLTSATDMTRDLLAKLNVSKEEPIHVCTGYVLDGVRQMLHAGGYNWQTAKITGPLQTLVETALVQRLHQIGVTDLDYETLTAKQGLAFYKCLKWLKGGNVNATRTAPERERFAKTGWATYRAWAYRPYAQAKAEARLLKQKRHSQRVGV